ncbi:hypothetical protein ACOMHN_051581 [Nucella lapillus]
MFSIYDVSQVQLTDFCTGHHLPSLHWSSPAQSALVITCPANGRRHHAQSEDTTGYKSKFEGKLTKKKREGHSTRHPSSPDPEVVGVTPRPLTPEVVGVTPSSPDP